MKDKEMPVTGFEPKGNQFGLRELPEAPPMTPLERKYLMLHGYKYSFYGKPEIGLRQGWQCMACWSMVYAGKCPNDECYNFQVLTSYRFNLENRLWEMLNLK